MGHDVGLRELRENASELVRRAENGERLTVTVAGRAAAVLGPTAERRWQSWATVAEVPGSHDRSHGSRAWCDALHRNVDDFCGLDDLLVIESV